MTTLRKETSLLIALITLGTVNCTWANTHGGHPEPFIEKPVVDSPRQIIDAREIASTHLPTAYELIEHLRPEFLNSNARRGTTGSRIDPVVFIDGQRAGGVSLLRDISPGIVTEIRYVPPRDAFVFYGDRSAGGQIMIYTRQ